jgi:hypothetical protein
MQLELFSKHPKEHLFPYWRKRLAAWPKEVWECRHQPHSTGWSMATQGGWFADLLFAAGELPSCEYRRWQRFEHRVLNFRKSIE